MYYPESEKKEFDKRRCANYHPKGIMPLGDCFITRMAEPDSPHMISIVNELSQVCSVFISATVSYYYHYY